VCSCGGNSMMFLDDYPIVIWFIRKKKEKYYLYDSAGVFVMMRNENRKQELYKYCEDIGIDIQEEF
jgi:hypothetical protein